MTAQTYCSNLAAILLKLLKLAAQSPPSSLKAMGGLSEQLRKAVHKLRKFEQRKFEQRVVFLVERVA